MTTEKEDSMLQALVRGLKLGDSPDEPYDFLYVYCWGEAPGSPLKQDAVVTDAQGKYLLCKDVASIPRVWGQARDVYKPYKAPTGEISHVLDLYGLAHCLRYSRKYLGYHNWDCIAFSLDAIRSKTCAMFDERDKFVLGDLLIYSMENGGIQGFFASEKGHSRRDVLRALNASVGGFLLNARVID